MTRDLWQDALPPESVRKASAPTEVKLVKTLADELGYNKVIDFGCGHGRLCESFHPDGYLGVDIDRKAVEVARAKFEKYKFDQSDDLPRFADIYLARSVFNQMNDPTLHDTLRRIRCKWLIIAESLSSEWKMSKAVPIYSRDKEEYIRIMRSHDLILHKTKTLQPQQHNKDSEVTYLVFRKCLKNPLA